jgi:hypothetical protein
LNAGAAFAVRDLPYETAPMRVIMLWHIHQDSQPAHRWFRRLFAETRTTCTGPPNSRQV